MAYIKTVFPDFVHRPDFVFISEPWMDYSNFPATWLHRLGLKIFCLNVWENLQPNLWCCCTTDLDPLVLDSDDQQIAFSFSINNQTYNMAAVYASTSNLRRKDLWRKLELLQSQHIGPWCYIGDFNAILGSHEHSGRRNPARPPMEDFQHWTDDNDLFHIPTGGHIHMG
jgi:hypothetical protein